MSHHSQAGAVMSKPKNTSAFPQQTWEIAQGGRLGQFTRGGLTKRELFAAMAMQGLLSNDLEIYRADGSVCSQGDVHRVCAAASVAYADELLRALEAKEAE